MSDLTGTVTISNPIDLSSIDELRQALHNANKALLEATLATAMFRRAAGDLSDMMAKILVAHLRKDEAGVQQHIEEAIERTAFSLPQADQGTVH